MSNYRKEIILSDTGMVIAEVFNGARRCGLKFFDNPFVTKENKFIKAHEWADGHIKLCRQYEVTE